MNKQELYDQLINLSFQEEQIKQVLPMAANVDQAVELILVLQEQGKLYQNVNDIPFKIDFDQIKGPLEMNDNRRFKMVCVVRMDLKMGIGKIAAQTGHAVLGAYKQLEKQNNNQVLKSWEESGQAKVVVKCESLQEFIELEKKAKQFGLNSYVVQDAGRTQVEPGSLTVMAIGPGDQENIDKVTGHLKLL